VIPVIENFRISSNFFEGKKKELENPWFQLLQFFELKKIKLRTKVLYQIQVFDFFSTPPVKLSGYIPRLITNGGLFVICIMSSLRMI